jgi:hypothetical protein
MQSKEWNMTNFAAPNMTAIGNITASATWDLGSNLPIQLGSAFTIEAWVRLDASNAAGGTIFFSSDGFQFGVTSNNVMTVNWNGQSLISGQLPLSPMTWTYVAATFDGQTASLYLDGAPDVRASTSGFSSTQPDLMIGGTNDPQGIDIWNLTLYNFARDAATEANAPWQDVGPTPGLVASYDFSVAPPRELIQGLPITPGNGAQSQTIAPAIAMVNQPGIALTPAYSFATTPQYTVSAWVASAGVNNTSGWQTVFFAGDASGSIDDAVWLGFGNSTLAASQRLGDALASADISINPQEWHNVAMTCDGSTLVAYLDGQPVASAATVPLHAGSTPMWHVGNNGIYGNFLNGWVQWLSIWSRALTPDEIVLQMYAEVANDAGIVVDCPMDVPPAQDVTSTVQLQLQGGAAFGEQRLNVSQWTPPSAQANPPDLHNVAHVTSLRVAPLPRSRGRVHPIPAFSDAHITAAIAELEPYLVQLHPSVAPEMRARVEERIRAVFKTAREHPESMRQVTSYHRDGEEWVLVFHDETEGDSELLRIALAELTPCQMWSLNFFFTLLYGVANILFLKIKKEDLTDGLARRLLNNQTVMEALTNVIQTQPALSANTLIGFLSILYNFGLLKSFLWQVLYTGGWWGLGKAFTWLAGKLIVGNAAAVAAWAVQSAVLVVKLALQVTGGPNVPSYSSSCG